MSMYNIVYVIVGAEQTLSVGVVVASKPRPFRTGKRCTLYRAVTNLVYIAAVTMLSYKGQLIHRDVTMLSYTQLS